MGKMVQYSTVDAVVSAYKLQEVPVFAVFHDKQLIAKWTEDDLSGGADHLEKVLEQLQSSGSYAICTLAVYEDFPEGKKINSSTPYDISFNFQLNKNTNVGRVGDVQRGSQDYTDLAVECAILKMRVAQMEADSDGEEMQEDKLAGILGQVMQIPGIDGLIGAIASRASEFVMSVGKNNNLPAEARIFDANGQEIKVRRVSGIDVSSIEAQRLHEAVEALQKKLPDCVELLEKLCRLADKNPFQFKFFVSGLRSMKV